MSPMFKRCGPCAIPVTRKALDISRGGWGVRVAKGYHVSKVVPACQPPTSCRGTGFPAEAWCTRYPIPDTRRVADSIGGIDVDSATARAIYRHAEAGGIAKSSTHTGEAQRIPAWQCI